jgi:hypothetical protein
MEAAMHADPKLVRWGPDRIHRCDRLRFAGPMHCAACGQIIRTGRVAVMYTVGKPPKAGHCENDGFLFHPGCTPTHAGSRSV